LQLQFERKLETNFRSPSISPNPALAWLIPCSSVRAHSSPRSLSLTFALCFSSRLSSLVAALLGSFPSFYLSRYPSFSTPCRDPSSAGQGTLLGPSPQSSQPHPTLPVTVTVTATVIAMGSTQFGNFHVSSTLLTLDSWIPGIRTSRSLTFPLSGMTGLLSRLDTASLQRTCKRTSSLDSPDHASDRAFLFSSSTLISPRTRPSADARSTALN
jgi:hypothetical protein